MLTNPQKCTNIKLLNLEQTCEFAGRADGVFWHTDEPNFVEIVTRGTEELSDQLAVLQGVVP